MIQRKKPRWEELRQALTREEREAIADDAVKRIADKPYDPWKMNEELPPPGPAFGRGSPEGWARGRE